MKHIEQAIGDLLLRHNCVIVPAFGGFVAEQLSAKIDYDKGIMLPPRKALLFNKQLVSNDGLLINELAARTSATFDEANQELSGVVSGWNHRLKKGERIELDRVGILFLDNENNLRFEQDRFFNLLLASFGMDQVHFVSQKEVDEIKTEAISINRNVIEPVLQQTEKEEVVLQPVLKSVGKSVLPVVEDESESKIIPITTPQRKSHKWKYMAAACFLPIAFYSIWIPMRTDVLQSGLISIKDFNPFYTSVEGNYAKTAFSEDPIFEKNTEPTLDQQINSLVNPKDVITYRYTEDTYVFVDISELNKTKGVEVSVPAEVLKEPVKEERQAPVIAPNSMNYIVGCFGSETNAKNMVTDMKAQGLNAFILDVKGGLHRVSAGAAISNEALNEIRTKADALGVKGWILN